MSYEPGSQQCRLLIEAKESLLNAMKAIRSLDNIGSIQEKLMDVYSELEDMHENRRNVENEMIYELDKDN